MVRRFAQVSLAVLLVLAVATMASAAPNVANTTQKGSLLVFPKVVSFTTPAVETYFFIGNDNTVGTYIKCYWMDNNQSVEDFHFVITANQPITFSTDDNEYGPMFGADRAGTLVCWAQNAEDTAPVAFNHLFGYAMISDGTNTVFYNAYSFAVRGTAFDDVSGYLPLNADTGYDGCPKYLITNFLPDGGAAIGGLDPTVNFPDITLWPCKQDLRQDRIPTCTKAKFDIWNGHEVKFTGAYQCFKCFFEGFLTDIGVKGTFIYARGKGFGGEKFGYDTLLTDVARLRVQGVKSSVCYGNTKVPSENVTCTNDQHVNTALLGVMLYGEPTTVPAFGINPVAGYTMHGASYNTEGFIWYDPSSGVDVAAK